MLALSVFVIALAQALPNWATEAKRDREARAIDYAREYRTAIKRYFHKNGRYPASIETLVQHDGNGLRYLRQPWQDPLVPAGASALSGTTSTGQEEFNGWQVIHFGQAVDAEIVDQPPESMRASVGGGISGPNLGAQPGGSAGGSVAGSTGFQTAFGSTQGTAAPGRGGPPAGAPGATGGPAAPGGPSVTNPAGGGGGAVIGIAPLSKRPAVHAFNGFDTPNDWQFVYNFAQDPTLRTGATPTNGLVPNQPSATPAPTAPGGVPPPSSTPPPAR